MAFSFPVIVRDVSFFCCVISALFCLFVMFDKPCSFIYLAIPFYLICQTRAGSATETSIYGRWSWLAALGKNFGRWLLQLTLTASHLMAVQLLPDCDVGQIHRSLRFFTICLCLPARCSVIGNMHTVIHFCYIRLNASISGLFVSIIHILAIFKFKVEIIWEKKKKG